MVYQEGHFVPALMVPNLNVRRTTTNSGSRPIKKNILSNGYCGRRPSVTRQHTHKCEQSLAACLNNKVTTSPLGRKWSSHFVERHLAIKTKLGRRTDWKRINAATPDNIRHLFNLYETVSWIPPRRRYNADEGGIMEGQGINGLVIGSSQENPNMVPVETINARTWTSIMECISALGVALNPLVIFKAKSI
ncbi:hypothetical protein ACKAV7_011955 [Fusarium commune]